MASVKTRLSYQKLKNQREFDEEKEEKRALIRRATTTTTRGWWLSRLRKLTGRKKRRRPRVQIPVLRRLLRRKDRFLSSVWVSWRKALKRLKKSQLGYLNDLFGGNYMFMQVSCPAPPPPPPLKSCGERVPYRGPHDLIHGISSRHS